jgi:hypothetical protein
MRNMGWNRKRDASEPAVVDALEQCGWSVLRISVTNGPDLVVSRAGRTAVVEVKTGKAKLKAGQTAWRDRWAGAVAVLRSVDDVIAWNRGEP